MNKKLQSLLNRAGIFHDTTLYVSCTEEQIEQVARLVANECALIVEAAIHHREPTSKFAKLITEEFND